jgi:hypothetical protein
MAMPSNLVALALVALVPLLSFALHRRLLPLLPLATFFTPDGPSPFLWVTDCCGVRHLRPLEPRYRGFNRLLLGLAAVFVLTLWILWTLLLAWLADLRLNHLPEGTLVLRPEPAWALWLLPGLFLALTSYLIPLAVLTRLLLGYGLADYVRHERARTGVDEWAGQKPALLFLLPLLGFTALAMNCSVRFEPTGIALHPFLSLSERVYPYSSVEQVVETSHRKAPLGNEVEGKRLYILFNDGRRWCNEDLARSNPFRPDEEKAIRLVCQRAGKPLTQARLLDDVLNHTKEPPAGK